MSHLPLQVNMSEFRENISAYLDAVEAGKIVTIMRRGKPSAVLEAAKTLPEPINLQKLAKLRASLGVEVDNDIISRMRKEERY